MTCCISPCPVQNNFTPRTRTYQHVSTVAIRIVRFVLFSSAISLLSLSLCFATSKLISRNKKDEKRLKENCAHWVEHHNGSYRQWISFYWSCNFEIIFDTSIVELLMNVSSSFGQIWYHKLCLSIWTNNVIADMLEYKSTDLSADEQLETVGNSRLLFFFTRTKSNGILRWWWVDPIQHNSNDFHFPLITLIVSRICFCYLWINGIH